MKHYANLPRSKLRLWVLPDEQARLSESGNIVTHVGAIDTIRIPADPLQRDYTLQFQISSEATRATLPKTGIQVFGAALHMHKAGLRGRLQLIRDGENVLDVYGVSANCALFSFRAAPKLTQNTHRLSLVRLR